MARERERIREDGKRFLDRYPESSKAGRRRSQKGAVPSVGSIRLALLVPRSTETGGQHLSAARIFRHRGLREAVPTVFGALDSNFAI